MLQVYFQTNTTTFIQCFTVFIGFVLLMLFDISLGEYSLQSVYELSSKEIFSIMFVGIVVGALIWLGISYIQKDVNPITVGIVSTTEPFFTLMFECLVLGRIFKVYELIGGLFIILATIVIAIDDNSKNNDRD